MTERERERERERLVKLTVASSICDFVHVFGFTPIVNAASSGAAVRARIAVLRTLCTRQSSQNTTAIHSCRHRTCAGSELWIYTMVQKLSLLSNNNAANYSKYTERHRKTSTASLCSIRLLLHFRWWTHFKILSSTVKYSGALFCCWWGLTCL